MPAERGSHRRAADPQRAYIDPTCARRRKPIPIPIPIPVPVPVTFAFVLVIFGVGDVSPART
ncbi:hypothetical protein [uncultured Tessaracoccus sp.]|uniref:hypothetical protein n=1 Tax=uncultured Tessaracoccus sp. TaxID=905023 RepID=UPI00260F92AC|nr:hypothetical protein [uncultured Tessaracoccus sp.]